MAVGESGRIVIEVDTGLKRELYAALDRDGLTLKDWFLRRANSYVTNHVQLNLELAPEGEEEVRS